MSWRDVGLVVFDLDGTLIDSLGDLANALNASLVQLAPQAPPLRLSQVRSFIGDGARLLVMRSLEAAGLRLPVDEALPVFVQAYRQRMFENTTLYAGVQETLDALRDRDLAVLTNKPGDMSRAILSHLGVAERFFRIVGAGDLAEHKPDPGGLLRLIAACGATPERTVIVGDSAVDVRTGRAAGTHTVGVTYGFAPDSLATEPPDALIDDLRDLPPLLGSDAAVGVVV
jgi:phosphoglycolate phosphatase